MLFHKMLRISIFPHVKEFCVNNFPGLTIQKYELAKRGICGFDWLNRWEFLLWTEDRIHKRPICYGYPKWGLNEQGLNSLSEISE